jgi:hypothetical protein
MAKTIIDKNFLLSESYLISNIVTILTQGKSNKIDIVYPTVLEQQVCDAITNSEVMKYGNRTFNKDVVNDVWSVIFIRKGDILFDSIAIEGELVKLGIMYNKHNIIYQGK